MEESILDFLLMHNLNTICKNYEFSFELLKRGTSQSDLRASVVQPVYWPSNYVTNF